MTKTFRIEHNGSDWSGSFQEAVTAALGGIVNDGMPIAVVLTIETHGDEPEQIEATVKRIDDRWLYIVGDGDDVIDRETLLGIDIP